MAARFTAGTKLTGAEIGVYKGKMSTEMLRHFPGLKLYMVDRWQAYSHDEKTGDPHCAIALYEQKTWDKIYSRLESLVAEFGNRAKIMKMDSPAAAVLCKNKYFDFVFIDGDHSYAGCRADIDAWKSKVKKGGFLCGHDITRTGVRKAVEETFGKNYVTDDDKTWWVTM